MNRIFTLTLGLWLLTRLAGWAQDAPYQVGLPPVSLTPQELFVLANIPELKLPDAYRGPDAPLLPSGIDNSTQPYFRPITWQSGYECGQSAGVAFNFTYEIDRLRGLPANTGANQYPTHFTWDFLNNANNYQGASFFDSWEIVRMCGNMNIADYGGALNTGGYTRWISGYDKYYNGMKNRLTTVKAIRVDTPEGLLTLKYWLYDHLEGSATGGVGNIYGQYFSPPVATFAAGTPEAGKYVQTSWGGSPSHAWTICGYNDSVRYDFNGDGQYTNNIDINNDGVVNMKDWEIGGLKFANGYAGNGWCNSGFCYTMYKNLADKIGYGGIWNHTVYVIDAKASYDPKLTMKITLKHTARNKLKVTAGVSGDPNATLPAYTQEYPIFNYQGGDLYMQGGTTEADKTIEFGLDLAPLLNQIPGNQPARFFLQVQENDPSGVAAGEIVSWSLIDYTSATPLTIGYPGINTAIQNNTVTRLFLNHSVYLNKPAVTNPNLPPAPLYQPYSVQLNATGGTAPYTWDVKLDYPEATLTSPFPAVTAQPLVLTNNNTGYTVKTLDFNFPFYQRSVNKIYIYADGYILFDDQPYTYPYLIDKNMLFRQTGIISPFMRDLTIYPSSGQGIWYEGSANYAIIRWKASLTGAQGSTNLNFAVKITPTGNIEFYYGDMVYPPGTEWTGGLSSGDNKNYQYSLLNNATAIASNTLDKYTTCGFPPEMQISPQGVFSGIPTHSYQNLPIKFQVTDNNNLTGIKTLSFNSFGLMVSQSVVSGNDSVIDFGETALMTLNLNNIGTQSFTQLAFSLRTTDPYISVTDSTESVPLINGGQNLTLNNAFTFHISPSVPDKHEFTMILHVQAQEQGFDRPLPMTAHAPVFKITGTVLNDGDNGMLDPGETADLLITYRNQGSSKATSLSFDLSSNDPAITLNTASVTVPQLQPDSSCTLLFNVTAAPDVPLEHLFEIDAMITADNDLTLPDTIYLFSGSIVEDFETGTFGKFPWYMAGPAPWLIEPGVKYEGSYSARSGWLGDSQESKLNLNVRVLTDGPLSFYKYISCESDPSGNHDYDYLVFLIDNVEIARWDGVIPWSKEVFWLTEGHHNLSWVYHKDYSVSAGWDGCLIDFITFPPIDGAIPHLEVTPASISETLSPGQSVTKNLLVTNSGGGIMKYSTIVFDTLANKKSAGGDNLGSSALSCNETLFTPGQAFSWSLTAHNLSFDNESVQDINLDLPTGMVVETATNFSGGSLGELVFEGAPGNGATLHWHGETPSGSGVLKPGEMATATITGYVQESFMDDIFMIYDLRGDSTGTGAHHVAGQIRVISNGLTNSWVSLENPTGSLAANQTGTVAVTLNAASLTPGVYRCAVIVRDLYNNKQVVPVTLDVPFPVSDGQNQENPHRLPSVQPNPFSDATTMRFFAPDDLEMTVEIFSRQGISVRRWDLKPTDLYEQSLIWDGTNQSGMAVPAGIYIGRLTTGAGVETFKLILTR